MKHVLVNLILLFFQFESFAIGQISVVRGLLFPLLLTYLVLRGKKMEFPFTLPSVICCFVILIEVLSGIGNGNTTFCISAFLHGLTLIVFIDYFLSNNGFLRKNWWILATYDIVTIFLFLYHSVGLSYGERFVSIYWDPNVMSLYILIALVAKINLIQTEKHKLIRVVFISLILMDVLILFSSQSRAALLSLAIILFVLLLRYSKKLLVVYLIVFMYLGGYLYNKSQNFIWSSDISYVDYLSYRIFISSENELENTSDGSRLGRVEKFVDYFQRGDVSIIGNGTNYMPDGSYMHNGLVEFILAVGLPTAILFYFGYLILLYRSVYLPLRHGDFNLSLLLPIAFLSASIFYSYLSYKSLWIFIAYLIFYDVKRSLILSNYKNCSSRMPHKKTSPSITPR